MARKKGLEGCFLKYGVWQEDMPVVEETCRNPDYQIDAEWLKERILKEFQDRNIMKKNPKEQQDETIRIVRQALKKKK